MNGLRLVLKWVLGSGFGGLVDMCVWNFLSKGAARMIMGLKGRPYNIRNLTGNSLEKYPYTHKHTYISVCVYVYVCLREMYIYVNHVAVRKL